MQALPGKAEGDGPEAERTIDPRPAPATSEGDEDVKEFTNSSDIVAFVMSNVVDLGGNAGIYVIHKDVFGEMEKLRNPGETPNDFFKRVLLILGREGVVLQP